MKAANLQIPSLDTPIINLFLDLTNKNGYFAVSIGN